MPLNRNPAMLQIKKIRYKNNPNPGRISFILTLII